MAHSSPPAAHGKDDLIKTDRENMHEVKVALDDALVRFMSTEAGYAENHTQMNVKIAVALLLNLVGGVTAAYAVRTPFETARFLTGVGSFTYLAIYWVWNLYAYFLAQQYVFCGQKSGKTGPNRVYIKSEASLRDSTYRLSAQCEKNGAAAEILSQQVDRWITVDGHIVPSLFNADMKAALARLPKEK